MRHLRAVSRLLAATILTLLLVLVWAIGNVIVSRSTRRLNRWRHVIMRVWGRGILRIMGGRLTVEGPVPQPPFCLVSNHLGYMDIFVMAATVQARLVSRADLAHWPAIGWLARHFGTLFLDRKRLRDIPYVADQMKAVLQEEDGVVFFPEGTSSSGQDVLPFRSPLLNVPVELGMPVHTAAIAYYRQAGNATSEICWWGDVTFTDHLYHLLGLPGFEARIVFGSEVIQGTDRKQLATDAERMTRVLRERASRNFHGPVPD
ncbi:MAG: lysophospholipid acyltransferase family protein [Rhodothermales bacterium]